MLLGEAVRVVSQEHRGEVTWEKEEDKVVTDGGGGDQEGELGAEGGSSGRECDWGVAEDEAGAPRGAAHEPHAVGDAMVLGNIKSSDTPNLFCFS